MSPTLSGHLDFVRDGTIRILTCDTCEAVIPGRSSRRRGIDHSTTIWAWTYYTHSTLPTGTHRCSPECLTAAMGHYGLLGD